VASLLKTKNGYATISRQWGAIRRCTSKRSTSSAKPKPRSPPCPPTSAQLPPRLRRPRNSCNISSLPSPFEREGPERQCTPDDAALLADTGGRRQRILGMNESRR